MVTGKVKATVKRERNANTSAELSHANWILLENTEQKREGWFYECLTTIVVAAFKFEAFLNHVGKALFPSYWGEMERLPHKQKRKIICAHLRIVEADGEAPVENAQGSFCVPQFRCAWNVRGSRSARSH